MYVIRKEQLFC